MPEMSWVDSNDGACTSGFVRRGKYTCAVRLYILGEMLARQPYIRITPGIVHPYLKPY